MKIPIEIVCAVLNLILAKPVFTLAFTSSRLSYRLIHHYVRIRCEIPQTNALMDMVYMYGKSSVTQSEQAHIASIAP